MQNGHLFQINYFKVFIVIKYFFINKYCNLNLTTMYWVDLY